jgi:hypothetical protein
MIVLLYLGITFLFFIGLLLWQIFIYKVNLTLWDMLVGILMSIAWPIGSIAFIAENWHRLLGFFDLFRHLGNMIDFLDDIVIFKVNERKHK